MFRRKGSEDEYRSDGSGNVQGFDSAKLRSLPNTPQSTVTPSPLPASRPASAGFHPDVPHRPAAPYAPPPAPAPEPLNRETSESKRLTVGRDITLAGEILDCERLTVEGTVRAKLSSARLLEIAKGGQFHGAVNIENAEIAGTFEGELNVRGRLHIHATGRVFGKVRYGQLDVERGGRVSGDVAHEAENADVERPFELQAVEARSA